MDLCIRTTKRINSVYDKPPSFMMRVNRSMAIHLIYILSQHFIYVFFVFAVYHSWPYLLENSSTNTPSDFLTFPCNIQYDLPGHTRLDHSFIQYLPLLWTAINCCGQYLFLLCQFKQYSMKLSWTWKLDSVSVRARKDAEIWQLHTTIDNRRAAFQFTFKWDIAPVSFYPASNGRINLNRKSMNPKAEYEWWSY